MKEHLYQLELSLLTPSVRQSAKELDRLLAPEFIEFGCSGKIYTKQTIIETLPSEQPINGTIGDFNLTPLSENVMLVRYRAVIDGATSLRSSIWRKNGDEWQMAFHQGTLIK